MNPAFNEECSKLAKGLKEAKVVPVVAVESVETGLKLCSILRASGLNCAEITFRTQAAAGTIRAVAEEFPDMLVGAGTVLNVDDLGRAKGAGAKFAVAPGCNPTVVSAAVSMAFPFFPGVASPSDIERACEIGCRTLKFFPAEAVGGVKLLKALIAPYKHLGVSFVPTGGITLDNMKSYLELREVVAVGGTWLAKSEDLKSGNWAAIERVAKETSAKLNS